jgi:DNA-binding transcriptional regulator/RsmH inhibitor MraZ
MIPNPPFTIKFGLKDEAIVKCYTTTLENLQVKIPSQFFSNGAQVAICPHPEGCLMLYPLATWEKIAETMQSPSALEESIENLFTHLLEEVAIETVEDQGLHIPEILKHFANLEGEVIWAETPNYVMLWQAKKFEERWSINAVSSKHENPIDNKVLSISIDDIEIYISKLIHQISQSHASLFEFKKLKVNGAITQLDNNRYHSPIYLHPILTRDAEIIIKAFQEAGAMNVVLRYEINDHIVYKDNDKPTFGLGKWAIEFTLTKLPDWCISYFPPKFLLEKHNIKST